MKRQQFHHYLFYALLAFSLTSLLASCGFQLKERTSLPASFGPVSIQGVSTFSPFYRAVRSALRQSSINIVEDTAASHFIHISPSRERKVLSVNTAGKVSEYELIQRLNYRVTSSNGTTLIAPTRLARSSYYTVSSTEVLGDSSEENEVYERLAEDLINQMFDQISAAL